MGLFSFNMKEGPGVDKNAKKKKGVFLYIDIVFRKFIKLLQANFLYFICSLPYLFLCLFISLMIMGMNGLGIEELSKNMSLEDAQITSLWAIAFITMFIFNFMGAGPVSASYAYVTRCFTRGEHTWIRSDGWDKFKENLKQSLLLLLLDVVVLLLGTNAMCFYREISMSADGAMFNIYVIARGLTTGMLFIYIVMHYFVYQIMVTYQCKFTGLIKYSIIITLAKLPMIILLSAITGAIFCFILFLSPVAAILIMATIGLTFTRYPLEFYAARVIEKNIKAERKKEKKRQAEITYIEE